MKMAMIRVQRGEAKWWMTHISGLVTTESLAARYPLPEAEARCEWLNNGSMFTFSVVIDDRRRQYPFNLTF